MIFSALGQRHYPLLSFENRFGSPLFLLINIEHVILHVIPMRLVNQLHYVMLF